ncbi:conserved hypothetical protein [Solidesulfovibrio fructosivorans JJ]]|uniref:GTP-binding protein n=1 Tax=Solidesulfovibrio fructosivorans JJ] TaxID=596151 RepID=E1JX49_SOLFR|nr:DUF4416 family protein [Solidesulfovibrio fructosivorans]EFL51014.1 conserved hypothetical protein [Solidesulfovibrio fructosivorans JJ]]
MSTPHEPLPGKLVCSVLAADHDALWPGYGPALQARFGPVELATQATPFTFTDYYDAELRGPLSRRMLVFANLLPQGGLRAAKLFTNDLERTLARPDGSRRVNFDPGLVTNERLVLATGKNFTHRLYLGDGIFGDLTLVFQAGSWQTLPWTFPDYASLEMLAILTDIRRRYRRDLREGRAAGLANKALPE